MAEKPPPKLPDREVLVLTELEQIKVLADPLRIRILEELVQERTTKQVADRLGERPTKLYHHVEALERVGLIRLTRTRPNRGTLEKYYQAVARSFRADASAFTAGGTSDAESGAMRDIVQTIFQRTAAEITRLLDSGCGDAIEEQGLLSFIEIRASREDIEELRRRLNDTIEWLSTLAEEDDDGEGLPRHRMTLAFFPLEPKAPAEDAE